MSGFIFGIPSYHRADAQPTLAMLERFGVQKGEIIIAVQCKEDRETYRQYSDRAQILFREGKNKSDNANTILDNLEIGKRLLLMDDDIRNINYLDSENKLREISTREQFYSALNVGFSLAKKCHAPGFGFYPVKNAFFMSHSYAKKNICIGTLLGMIVTKQRFDNKFSVKEDYEYTAAAIKKYGAFPRLNNFVCEARHYTKGGCSDLWEDGFTNGLCAGKLCARYPRIVKPNKNRPGEVKMAHTEKPIPYHWKFERE